MEPTLEQIRAAINDYMSDMDLDMLTGYVYFDLMDKMANIPGFYDKIVKENDE